MARASAPQPMRTAPDAAPLRPEELRRLRSFLRKPVLEEHLAPADVAKRLSLAKETVLDLVQRGEFPNAFKPFPNKIRIPVSDVVFFAEKHRVKGVQATALEESEVRDG